MIAPDRQANNVVVSFVPMLKGVVLRCNVAQKRPPSMRTLGQKTQRSDSGSTTGSFTTPACPGGLLCESVAVVVCHAIAAVDRGRSTFRSTAARRVCPTISDAASGMRRKSGALRLGFAARLFARACHAAVRLSLHGSQHLHALAPFVADLGIGALQIDGR